MSNRDEDRDISGLQCAIGIDVGGTKCAAGLVTADGQAIAQRLQPTRADRGGAAILADVLELIVTLQDEARRRNLCPSGVGIGIPELVTSGGVIASNATFDWRQIPICHHIETHCGLYTHINADVRAAAWAEAVWGVGKEMDPFLYVTVGTGISASLVIRGTPYLGARGFPGTIASSPTLFADALGQLVSGPALEQFASGPALASRYRTVQNDFQGTAAEVIARAAAGNRFAQDFVISAGRGLGAALAQLVNMLDPESIVIGGGLGLVHGLFRTSLIESLRQHVYCTEHRDIQVRDAQLGVDAGWMGAALGALREKSAEGKP